MEHAAICEKRGSTDGGPGREQGLTLLPQQRHEQLYTEKTNLPL